jgi:hypothetical protein
MRQVALSVLLLLSCRIPLPAADVGPFGFPTALIAGNAASPVTLKKVSNERDIVISAHANWTLKGKLAIPDNYSPITPVVVLIHGSGPNDMDESLPGSITATGKPAAIFKDISDSLVKSGFAVFRYNKRGVLGWNAQEQKPIVDENVYAANTVDDLVRDAVTATLYLRSEPRFSKRPVILLGHSEGTMLAPLAARSLDVNGLVLLSAMARRLDVILYYQNVTRQLEWCSSVLDKNSDGFILPEEAALEPRLSLDFTLMDTDKDGRISTAELTTVLERFHQKTIEKLNSDPWFQSHLKAEPNYQVLPEFSGPILIVQGEEDRQTPMQEVKLLDAALREGGHSDYTIKTFPGLGHGFSPPIDGWIPTIGPVEPQVLNWLSQWLSGKFLQTGEVGP